MIQAELLQLLELLNSREVYRTGQNGTAAYTSPTTLTLTVMPFAPTDVDFLAVIEYGAGVPGTDATYVYWSPNAEPEGIATTHPMSYNQATGVLTVQRATFDAASSFVVVYSGLYTTPLAAVGHNTLGAEETKPVQVIQWDPAKLNVTATIINQIIAVLGQGGAWISPVDFTATWVNATQLTIAALPADLVPTDVEIRAVIEWNAAGVADVYVPEVNHFDWTAPTLTVTGATFTNTSQFMVVIVAQQKGMGIHDAAAPTYGRLVGWLARTDLPALVGAGDFVRGLATRYGALVSAAVNDVNNTLHEERIEQKGTAAGVWGKQVGGTAYSGIPAEVAATQFAELSMTLGRLARTFEPPALERILGEAGIYHSPTDFNAAWASATTLTLTGMPFVPVDAQFLGVVETTATGKHIYYSPSDNYLFTFVAATGVLTVTTAAFTNGSLFTVLIAGQHKGYDSMLNALQVVQLNARAQDFVDAQVVIAAGTAIATNSGAINVKGMTHVTLFYDWTSGAGAGVHDLLVTMTGNPTDAGATEYDVLDGPEGTSVNGAATAHDASEIVDVTAYDRVWIYVDEQGGTGKGTIGLTVTMMNN